jgi:hypothetical protein
VGIGGLDLDALGIPGALLRAVSADGPVTPFHTAFSLFRLAVVFEGIAVRAVGIASLTMVAHRSPSEVFARRGVEAGGTPGTTVAFASCRRCRSLCITSVMFHETGPSLVKVADELNHASRSLFIRRQVLRH